MSDVSRDPSAPKREAAPPARDPTITEILNRCSDGDPGALNEVLPLVYDDLRRIAHRRLQAERTDHTLDTTAIVHEAYINLAGQAAAGWNDRAHFFAVSARIIRNLLVDYARRHGSGKRGGDWVRIPLRPDIAVTHGEEGVVELLVLDQALSALGRHEASLERIVECRFFAGMTVGETARALELSPRTIARDWRRAKAYLLEALS